MTPLNVFALMTMTPLWTFLIGSEHRLSQMGHRLVRALEQHKTLVHKDKGLRIS